MQLQTGERKLISWCFISRFSRIVEHHQVAGGRTEGDGFAARQQRWWFVATSAGASVD